MAPNDISTSLRVLLVEDDEHDRIAFRRALQKSQLSYEITECIRAEEALERLRTKAPSFDLAVIDHQLPGMPGFELCKTLLAERVPVPLVILTGKGSERLAVDALKAGVDDYIVKDPSEHYLDLLPVVLVQTVRRHGDRMARKRAEERLLTYHNRLRSLASALSLAEEQERRKIADEVHEQIGQNLAFAKIKLGKIRELAISGNLGDAVDEVIKVIDETIEETRALVFQVSSPILYELGFVMAVESLTRQSQKQHGISMAFEDDGQPKPLSDDVRVLLFQAVRELLANVVRHAQAKTAKVSIAKGGDEIIVDVKDDGIGFEPAQIGPAMDQEMRFGLFSIRERLESLGGSIQIESKRGHGTLVTLSAPLSKEEENDK
jgi:signal transduction histidine kinase